MGKFRNFDFWLILNSSASTGPNQAPKKIDKHGIEAVYSAIKSNLPVKATVKLLKEVAEFYNIKLTATKKDDIIACIRNAN